MPNEACTSVEVGVNKRSAFLMPTTAYQDLLEYLARPRMVQSGVIPTLRGVVVAADVSRTNLFTWFPSLANRLAGVHGIRFKIKFMFSVASTPFQQALLCMSFQYGSFQTNTTVYPRSQNSAFVTNLPHVLHDITETTLTQLEIPYLSPLDYMVLNSNGLSAEDINGGTLGIIAVNTLLPYRALAGANSPTFKFYVSLHDVELIGSQALVYNSVTIQSGLPPIVKEEQQVRGSDQVLQLSTKIRTISSYIPFLSSVGSTTSNALDLAANVAKAFGFAKPQVSEPPNRVYRTGYIGEGNVDIPNSSYVLAPFQSNRLAVDALAGGTDVDEMALQYVIGKYGQIFLGNMATADAAGTPLYAAAVCPTNFWFRTNAGRPGGNLPLPAGSTATTNALALSPLAYTAQFFRYWRGGMRFRFTFGKTKFHGGRVLISYIPELDDVDNNGVGVTTVPAPEVSAGAPQPFNYSKLCDLRDSNVFEFDVPYICPVPYNNVLSASGGVTMYVVDPLVTSGETSTAIDYLVEVKALDDFEFACPAPPMFSIATPGANIANTVFLQSGLGGEETIGEDAAQYTVGESIRSFKQIMMIPSYVTGDFSALSITNTALWPFYWFGRFTMAVPLPPTTNTIFGFTRSACVAAMYAFATGSTQHHAYLQVPEKGVFLSINQRPEDYAAPASSNGDPRRRSETGIQRVVGTDGAIHARVPSYQRVARVPIWLGNSNSSYTIPSPLPSGNNACTNVAGLTITNASAAAVRVHYGRAAADDARCTAYIGPPPVALLQGTQTTVPDNVGSASF